MPLDYVYTRVYTESCCNFGPGTDSAWVLTGGVVPCISPPRLGTSCTFGPAESGPVLSVIFLDPERTNQLNSAKTNFTVTLRQDFSLHFKKMKTKSSRPCKTCGKLFQSSWHVKRHELVHSGEKPFEVWVFWIEIKKDKFSAIYVISSAI